MFITGMAGFSLFSLLVAFAQNPFWMLIVCGVLGIPAAMVVPPAIGICEQFLGAPLFLFGNFQSIEVSFSGQIVP